MAKTRTSFKKGTSGNPAGRPPAPEGLARFRELCRGHSETAVKALVAALADADNCVAAAKVLLEFAWGKPPQAHVFPDGEGGEAGGLRIVIEKSPPPKE